MMSRPSCEQLVHLVRSHLETVAEAITDVQAKGALVMIDSILANVANRSGHEVAWMHEEISALSPRRTTTLPMVSRVRIRWRKPSPACGTWTRQACMSVTCRGATTLQVRFYRGFSRTAGEPTPLPGLEWNTCSNSGLAASLTSVAPSPWLDGHEKPRRGVSAARTLSGSPDVATGHRQSRQLPGDSRRLQPAYGSLHCSL